MAKTKKFGKKYFIGYSIFYGSIMLIPLILGLAGDHLGYFGFYGTFMAGFMLFGRIREMKYYNARIDRRGG